MGERDDSHWVGTWTTAQLPTAILHQRLTMPLGHTTAICRGL
jgi:hypothetical protein